MVGVMVNHRASQQSIEELEGARWGDPALNSYLVTTVHRLRRKPLSQFTIEDLRIMINQQVGVEYLVPQALGHLEMHPLASGDFYPGDLLAAVARLPDSFWSGHRQLIPRAVRAIDGALARVHKAHTVGEVADELRAARSRLMAIGSGDSVV